MSNAYKWSWYERQSNTLKNAMNDSAVTVRDTKKVFKSYIHETFFGKVFTVYFKHNFIMHFM